MQQDAVALFNQGFRRLIADTIGRARDENCFLLGHLKSSHSG